MKDINATILVDVGQSVYRIFKNLKKDARLGIKKSKKSGLSVKESNSEEDWKDFYEIYKVIMKDGGTSIFPLEDIKSKSKAFLVCKKGKKVVGGAIILFSERYDSAIPRLYIIAADKDYWNLQPNSLIYWTGLIWAKSKGYKKFDLGGWQIKARGHLLGVNKFKEKWGDVLIYKKEYPILEALGRKIIRNLSFAKYIWDKFKGRI